MLVIRGGAIGDFVLTLPVFSALRAAFPDTHLAVLGYPRIATLALAAGLVDEVRPIEAPGLATFFCPRAELPAAFAEYFERFAVILSYLYDPDAIFQTNVRRCTRAQFIQGPHRPADADGVHATDVLLQPLARLAVFDPDPVPRLSPPRAATADSTPAGARRGPLLAAHPGSGSERKNWPEAHWQRLLATVAQEPATRLLLVGGEAEVERVRRLSAHWPGDRLEVAVNLPLPELAGRLAACDVFLGHDSGITHLAAALGLSGLALWGETSETVWRPRSERMRLLRASGGLNALPPAQVHEALRDLLARHEDP